MNVVQLPTGNVQDLPAMARRFAEDLERGDYGEVNTILVVIDGPSTLEILNWGDNPTVFGAIGLLEVGKGHMVRMLLEGE
jgi:hypothetical protein